jgi:hypothetical protein
VIGKDLAGTRNMAQHAVENSPAASIVIHAELEEMSQKPATLRHGVIPIAVMILPDEAARTSNSAWVWIAEATVEGRTYTALSRHGPANELARQLVAAGLPDRPMVICYLGLAGPASGFRSSSPAALRALFRVAKSKRSGAPDHRLAIFKRRRQPRRHAVIPTRPDEAVTVPEREREPYILHRPRVVGVGVSSRFVVRRTPRPGRRITMTAL